MLAGFILPSLPFAHVALTHLSAAVTRAANDTGTLLVNVGLDLVLAMTFGALIGWLGGWSILRLGPPREPPNGQI